MSADALNPDALNDRLAEAARFAVLNRLMPVLRHDVAGAMQPNRMLLMVLEKRLQNAEPDLQAIRATVASMATLTKQATASCISALGWVAAAEDTQVSLRGFVDAAAGLLALDLLASGFTLVNAIEDDSASASQNFLRSVLMGALLAFCDQHAGGGTLQISCKPADTSQGIPAQIDLCLLQGSSGTTAIHDVVRKYRLMNWSDVQAMARASGVQMVQGHGCMNLKLPMSG